MSMNRKIKKNKRLPLYIDYAIILSYFIMIFIGIVFIQVLVASNIENIRNLTVITFIILAPLMGFTIGWYIKFRYIKKNGDEHQLLYIKAQFWSAIAFLMSFVISLLLILLILIQLENNVLPKSIPDLIVFAFSMSLMGISLYVANNTRKRIHRNFGY